MAAIPRTGQGQALTNRQDIRTETMRWAPEKCTIEKTFDVIYL